VLKVLLNPNQSVNLISLQLKVHTVAVWLQFMKLQQDFIASK